MPASLPRDTTLQTLSALLDNDTRSSTAERSKDISIACEVIEQLQNLSRASADLPLRIYHGQTLSPNLVSKSDDVVDVVDAPGVGKDDTF